MYKTDMIRLLDAGGGVARVDDLWSEDKVAPSLLAEIN